MAQHIEAPLLELVSQPQQRQGTPGVPHQEQQLRPPELHVLLPDIQPEQVFAHLGTKVKWWGANARVVSPHSTPLRQKPQLQPKAVEASLEGRFSQIASSPPTLLHAPQTWWKSKAWLT